MSLTITEQKVVTPIRCHRCKHEWNYGGKNSYVATCPHCRTQLSIRKHSIKVEDNKKMKMIMKMISDDKALQPGLNITRAQAARTTISPAVAGDKDK